MIRIERSGKQVWGSVRSDFAAADGLITILFDHNGHELVGDWRSDFRKLQNLWDSVSRKLDLVLPGGMDKCNLYSIDFRNPAVAPPAVPIPPAFSILHFSTTEDLYDWYVRLDYQGCILLARPKD